MLAVAAMISFTACEKDGGDEKLPNEFILGSESHALGNAICYYHFDTDYQIDEFDLWLTDRLYWNTNGDWYFDSSKYANGLQVNLYWIYGKDVAKGSLPTGKFTYSDTPGNLKHDGRADYYFSDENGDGNTIEFGQDSVRSSQLVIEIKHIKGNIYEIIFTGGLDEYGNPVNGYYRGAVDIVEG